MSIELDRSQRSIVVTCSEHPWWSDVASSAQAARRMATEHERAAHEVTDRRAANAEWMATRRAAG